MASGIRAGCLASICGYVFFLASGSGFVFLKLIPFLQVVWTIFCVSRMGQLRRGAHKKDATEWDRTNLGFVVGGLLSSVVIFVALLFYPWIRRPPERRLQPRLVAALARLTPTQQDRYHPS
jgi:hypothetical protein